METKPENLKLQKSGVLDIKINGIDNLKKIKFTSNKQDPFLRDQDQSRNYSKLYVPIYKKIYNDTGNDFTEEFKEFAKKNTDNNFIKLLSDKSLVDKFIDEKQKNKSKDDSSNTKETFKCNTIGVIKKVIVNNPKASFIYNKNIKDPDDRSLYYINLPVDIVKQVGCSTTSLPSQIVILDESIADSNYTSTIIDTLLNKNIKDKNKRYEEEKKKNVTLYSDEETRSKINKELLEEHTRNITTTKNIYKVAREILIDNSLKLNQESNLPIDNSKEQDDLYKKLDPVIRKKSEELLSRDKENLKYTTDVLKKKLLEIFKSFYEEKKKFVKDKKEIQFNLVLDENLKTIPLSIFKKQDRQELIKHIKKRKEAYVKKCKNGMSENKKQVIKSCNELCDPSLLSPPQTDCSYNNWCNICRNYVYCVYGENIENKCPKNQNSSFTSIKDLKSQIGEFLKIKGTDMSMKLPTNYMEKTPSNILILSQGGKKKKTKKYINYHNKTQKLIK